MLRQLRLVPLFALGVVSAGCGDEPSVTPNLDGGTTPDAAALDATPDRTPDGDAALPSTRKVFAHYMVAIRTYGGGLDAYKRDIQEARAAGIDGFALNEGSWRNGNYKGDTALLFEAAKQIGGFSLFFSIDMSGDFTGADVREMMELYAAHPAYLLRDGRPVLSTYAGEAGGVATALPFWRDQVLVPLRNEKIDPFFVPFFYPTNFGQVNTTNLEADYQSWWKDVIDGWFNFGAAGLPSIADPSLLAQNEAGATVMHAHKLLFMSSVSPQYWGGKQKTAGRRYFEFEGGEGLERQWRSVIDTQKADWVELTTWNDFGEASYFSPVDDVSKYWPYEYVTELGFFKTHAGETSLNHYFVDWYKSGAAPAIAKDSLVYFYRTHPKDAVASADPLGPVTNRSGPIKDELFVTTLLTAAGELRVSTNGVETKLTVPAGLHHSRVPFQPGAQAFSLWRSGAPVVSVTGEPIVASPKYYDFNYVTGSVTAP